MKSMSYIGAALLAAALGAGCQVISGVGDFEVVDTGTGGSSGTGGMSNGCTTAAECDDGKPCTQDKCDLSTGKCSNEPNDTLAAPQDVNDCDVEVCKSGAVVHQNLADTELCGTGAPLHCNGMGQCVGCAMDSDCGTSSECVTYACNASQICETTMVAQGTKVTDPTPSDCKGMFCDGAGMTVAGPDDTDWPMDDGNSCTDDVCANGMADHPLKAAGTACVGGTTFCSSTGTCVACAIDANCPMGSTCYMESQCVSCTDGMKNGSETGVDCGGSCKKCNGETCATGADCKSTFCADGVCCDTACDANNLCRSCNQLGKMGTCSVVQGGMQDPDTCTMGSACNGSSGGGACYSIGTKMLLGKPCLGNSDCLSNHCIAGNICGLIKGESCPADYTCSTKLCLNNICTECASNADCASGVCDTGAKACKIPLGEPCTSTAEPGCAQGTCQGKLCKLNNGDTCTKNSDCLGVCDAMMKCANCQNNADCGGATCSNGVCLLSAGTSCTDGQQCSSGICTGFPPKCQ